MDIVVSLLQELLLLIYSFAPHWALALVIFTFVVRIVVLPLHAYASIQQKRLQKISPQLKSLQENYNGDFVRIYSESKRLKKQANISSWALPLSLVIQLPIFYGIFKMIGGFESLQGASFMWIASLSQADPLFLLPVGVALVTYWQQKSNPAKESPIKIPDWVLPGLSFAFMCTMPAALTLYYLIGGILQAGAQTAVERFYS